MSNLNFDFSNFADLDEAIEREALNILANEPAEIIHISDKELELMAEGILIEEVIKEERKQEMIGNYILGSIAALPVIGMLLLTCLLFTGKLTSSNTCTPSPDVCEIQSLPPMDKEGNVMRGW